MEDVDRAGAGAARRDALEKKGAGGLRLQVKYNAVYAYEVLGCGQEEFVKDWNKTTGSVLGVGLDPTKFSKWIKASKLEDWGGSWRMPLWGIWPSASASPS